MTKNVLLALCAISTVALASPALADNPNVPPVNTTNDPCGLTYVSNAVACYGYLDNNGFNNSNFADQQAAINTLLSNATTPPGYNSGLTLTGLDWNTLTGTGNAFGNIYGAGNVTGGNVLNLGVTLTGLSVIGFHFGNNTDPLLNGTNASVYYLLDFGTGGNTVTFTPNANGFSNGIVYGTNLHAVPEPATWGLMLLGFGGIGMVLRRKRAPAALAQLA